MWSRIRGACSDAQNPVTINRDLLSFYGSRVNPQFEFLQLHRHPSPVHESRPAACRPAADTQSASHPQHASSSSLSGRGPGARANQHAILTATLTAAATTLDQSWLHLAAFLPVSTLVPHGTVAATSRLVQCDARATTPDQSRLWKTVFLPISRFLPD